MSDGSSDGPVRRILLVEDDLDQAHLVKFLLEQHGSYSVTLAQDGVRGTLLVTEHHWDLVITDLNLPGVNGIAVIEASLKSHPETPVLAMTGYTGPEYADHALHTGAAHVLIKPLQKDELLAKVAELARAEAPTGAASADSDSDSAEADNSLRVLAIGVRPGDAEAGCGGILIRHRDRGDRVILLTLTHGSPAEDGRRRREAAKRAGRDMGVRFFVGNAGSGDEPLESDVRRLVKGAITEIRPNIVYVPTAHHSDPTFRVIHEAATDQGRKVESILAYDPGDASPDFHPRIFVNVGETLEEKLGVLDAFAPQDGDRLSSERVRVGAAFWSRHAGGRPAEALEEVRGRLPSGITDN